MRNENFVAERIGPLAHDGGYSLSCGAVFMRTAVMPNLDRLLIRQTEVDGKNPSAPPLAQLACPLMGHHIVGYDRHGKHDRRPKASGLRLDACTQDPTLKFGGREVHENSHASSICTLAL